ncbi:MAG: PilZ domain-containing protein [Planctomycetes bacterium]|nr:PilZ domain-containing protein [Planctomycetota bacterium]
MISLRHSEINDRRRRDRARVQKCGGTFAKDSFFTRLGLTTNYAFRVVDCSPTGMKVASYRPLDRFERFVFKFPAAKGGLMKVAGHVVWTEQVSSREEQAASGAWIGGVRFDGLEETDENRLLLHMERHREQAVSLRKQRVVRYYGKGGN